jgi:prophage regulatory protein
MSERFLRLTEVQRRVPFSRSTIYLKVSRGEFPSPVNLGARAVAWLESDIDAWIESRIAKGRVLASMAPARQPDFHRDFHLSGFEGAGEGAEG